MDFMDFIQSIKKPQQLLSEALEKDDVNEMKSLMEKNTEFTDPTKPIEIDKNILSMAVSARADKCVYHLVNALDFPLNNAFIPGWNAVVFAMFECHLPILHSILTKYGGGNDSTWQELRPTLPRSVNHFNLIDFLLWPKAEIIDFELHCFWEMMPNPGCLYYELRQTPSVKLQLQDPGKLYQKPTEGDSEWWHAVTKTPLYLSELARRCIRETLTQTTGVEGVTGSNENYFYRIGLLDLPTRLKRFLCYEELWPIVQDKTKRPRYIRRGIRPETPLVMTMPRPIRIPEFFPDTPD